MVDETNSINENKDNVVQITSEKMSIRETNNSFLPNNDAENIIEHTSLWRAVITQALMDAGSNSKKIELKKEKARAISWLNGDSEDFYEVCFMADLDPEYVKQNAKEAIKRGCKWRKESNPFKIQKLKNQIIKDQAKESDVCGFTDSVLSKIKVPDFLG